MIYLLEKRHTVGSFKTIYSTTDCTQALAKLGQEMGKITAAQWHPHDGGNPDEILTCVKIGDAHDNTILRIRIQKEE